MAAPKQLHSLINDKIDKAKHEMFTGLPAKIISYDANSQSCTAQPVFQTGELPMPPIYNVPVIFPAGGGAVMSFPVKAGDRCWLAFSMYPISQFFDGSADSDTDNPMESTHDYSECVAFVGLGTRLKNYVPDPTLVMIRFGKTKLTMDDAENVTIEGNLHVTKKIVADDTVEGKDFISSETGITFNGHKHHYFWTDPSGDSDTETPS